MTPDKATALREAAERATLGPWGVEAGDETQWIGPEKAHPWPRTKVGDIVATVDGGPLSGYTEAALAQKQANAAYIALADPPTIIALLAERERLRGALEGLFNASASLFNEAASLVSETPRGEALSCTKDALTELLPEFERARQALEATDDQ